MLSLLLAASVVSPEAPALAEGDAYYARRAEGAHGSQAAPAVIGQAVTAYRSALSVDPDSNEARARLLKALFFRASFCGAPNEERKQLFEEARTAGEAGLTRLEARLGKLAAPARVTALRERPGAVALQLWTAIAWGEWALARGKFAAARAGAATRVRDLAQAVIDADPQLEGGGGFRVMGRLHDQSPRIPFITGWISRSRALECLRRALELGPANLVTQLFLAEAILGHDEDHAAEARKLLAQCARTKPRPEYPVEDTFYAERCSALLAPQR